MNRWKFLTNHGLVYLHKVLNPESTVREIAVDLSLTERAVHRILRDLEHDHYLVKERIGRRAYYRLSERAQTMRHDLVKDVDVLELLSTLTNGRFPDDVAPEVLPPAMNGSSNSNGQIPVAIPSI